MGFRFIDPKPPVLGPEGSPGPFQLICIAVIIIIFYYNFAFFFPLGREYPETGSEPVFFFIPGFSSLAHFTARLFACKRWPSDRTWISERLPLWRTCRTITRPFLKWFAFRHFEILFIFFYWLKTTSSGKLWTTGNLPYYHHHFYVTMYQLIPVIIATRVRVVVLRPSGLVGEEKIVFLKLLTGWRSIDGLLNNFNSTKSLVGF